MLLPQRHVPGTKARLILQPPSAKEQAGPTDARPITGRQPHRSTPHAAWRRLPWREPWYRDCLKRRRRRGASRDNLGPDGRIVQPPAPPPPPLYLVGPLSCRFSLSHRHTVEQNLGTTRSVGNGFPACVETPAILSLPSRPFILLPFFSGQTRAISSCLGTLPLSYRAFGEQGAHLPSELLPRGWCLLRRTIVK